nr:hypothetical protein CFOL_v3_27320 [Ipomoea batatas]
MAAPRLRAGLMPVPVMGMVAKDMGVSGISLGISCREYDIDKDEGSNDLSTKAITLGVAMSHHVGPSPITRIQRWLEPLHNPCTTDGS